MTPQEKQQLNEVYEFIQSLKRSSSIPRDIDQSFRERFLKGLIKFEPTTDIHATDRDQTTSAGGGDSVPQIFTDLTKVFDPNTGTYKYYPYYQ